MRFSRELSQHLFLGFGDKLVMEVFSGPHFFSTFALGF